MCFEALCSSSCSALKRFALKCLEGFCSSCRVWKRSAGLKVFRSTLRSRSFSKRFVPWPAEIRRRSKCSPNSVDPWLYGKITSSCTTFTVQALPGMAYEALKWTTTGNAIWQTGQRCVIKMIDKVVICLQHRRLEPYYSSSINLGTTAPSGGTASIVYVHCVA